MDKPHAVAAAVDPALGAQPRKLAAEGAPVGAEIGGKILPAHAERERVPAGVRGGVEKERRDARAVIPPLEICVPER